ncbi:MAG: hypothetical protein ABIT38_24720 [Gemmatimonadaceae bacterium]
MSAVARRKRPDLAIAALLPRKRPSEVNAASPNGSCSGADAPPPTAAIATAQRFIAARFARVAQRRLR